MPHAPQRLPSSDDRLPYWPPTEHAPSPLDSHKKSASQLERSDGTLFQEGSRLARPDMSLVLRPTRKLPRRSISCQTSGVHKRAAPASCDLEQHKGWKHYCRLSVDHRKPLLATNSHLACSTCCKHCHAPAAHKATSTSDGSMPLLPRRLSPILWKLSPNTCRKHVAARRRANLGNETNGMVSRRFAAVSFGVVGGFLCVRDRQNIKWRPTTANVFDYNGYPTLRYWSHHVAAAAENIANGEQKT